MVEEYGLVIDASRDVPDTAARDAAYTAWTNAVEAAGPATVLVSYLRVDEGLDPNYDGYRIIWQNDPANDSNSTALLLSAHAKRMAPRAG